MKARLPYFLLALLSGCFFFSGTLQAKTYTEGCSNYLKNQTSVLTNQHQAERAFNGLYHLRNADQGLTYKRRGSAAELLEVDSKIVGGASQAVFISVVGAAENRGIRLLSNMASFSARANDAEESKITDSRTTSPGASLYRKQMASFFDSFL